MVLTGVLIYRDFYRRICRILCRLRFSCTNFNNHLKSQSFKIAPPGCVCTEYRTILNISESLYQNETGIKKI